MKNTKWLVIMRGLPGSGKSYEANFVKKNLENYNGRTVKYCSTDDFWGDDYDFDASKLGEAHAWNLTQAKNAISSGYSVIVDNTNVCLIDFIAYVMAAYYHNYKIVLVEPKTTWKYDVNICHERNTHGVPHEVIKRMWMRWQSSDRIVKALGIQDDQVTYTRVFAEAQP